MLIEQVLNAVNAEPTTSSVGKQDIPLTSLGLAQLGFAYGTGGFGQWRTTLSPSLADHPQVTPGPEDEILTFEPGHLREAEAGLGGGQNKSMIASAGPGVPIGCGKQRIDFRACEKTDQGAREALAWNRQNPLDLGGVLGRLEGCITKKGMDRRQTQVTRSDADAVVLLQVIEELPDQGRANLLELQLRRRLM